jgi:hypothetical protein
MRLFMTRSIRWISLKTSTIQQLSPIFVADGKLFERVSRSRSVRFAESSSRRCAEFRVSLSSKLIEQEADLLV